MTKKKEKLNTGLVDSRVAAKAAPENDGHFLRHPEERSDVRVHRNTRVYFSI